jgi:hypothetical protein
MSRRCRGSRCRRPEGVVPGLFGLAWSCDLGHQVRRQRAGPLLHQRMVQGLPVASGRTDLPGRKGTGLPGPDHAQDACRRPGVEYAGDLGVPPTPLRQWGIAQDRSGRAAERTHSRSAHRNGYVQSLAFTPALGGPPDTVVVRFAFDAGPDGPPLADMDRITDGIRSLGR